MKNNVKTVACFLFFHLSGLICANAQQPLWSEDFSAYVENTGYEGSATGPVAIGDYPANVTKWTLDVSGCTLTDQNDYFKTKDYSRSLQGRDLDGGAVWLSEAIDISGFANVMFSLEARQSGAMLSSDYFDVFYQLDGGEFSRIPNWNGQGNDDHTLVGQFVSPTVIAQENLSGSVLVIKVIQHNNGTWEIHTLDNISVSGYMQYVSSTVSQNTEKIAPGKMDQHIIGVEIVTTGTAEPIEVTAFSVNANGSSIPVLNNIENAKIFYTGVSDRFETIHPFGSTVASPTIATFDVTGVQPLVTGTNYFWLTFDTKPGANIGEVVDAECVMITINGTGHVPATTAPAGNRLISSPLNGSFTIGSGQDYATFSEAATDLNNLGVGGPVTFSVDPGYLYRTGQLE